MSLAFESILTAPGHPVHAAPAEQREPCLNITVVFTSVEATLAALKEAGVLAGRLCGHITLVVPQVVPYPLPLTSPPVLLDWSERRFRVIASDSPVETKVALYLCRDRVETLTALLSPHSLVVLGGRKRWWPTARNTLGEDAPPRRTRSDFHGNGVTLRCLICSTSLSVACSCSAAGPSRRPATSFRRKTMDYIIAGIASIGLFIYLIYALLRPEKF